MHVNLFGHIHDMYNMCMSHVCAWAYLEFVCVVSGGFTLQFSVLLLPSMVQRMHSPLHSDDSMVYKQLIINSTELCLQV